MRRYLTLFLAVLGLAALLAFAHGRTLAQSPQNLSRIIAPIDESRLTVLRGNTTPFARSAYDRGPAADSLRMDRMVLVLRRSAAQQEALDRLLAEQQDKDSANYRRWLTPAEFGAQFGASDDDVQKISGWLQSHGFQVDDVAQGRNLITFSGNAAQVRSAFHTTIHQYAVNNIDHIANNADPAIPAALASVVAGVRSLNDFFPQASHNAVPISAVRSAHRNFTLTDAHGNTLYGVGPADFATIYGVQPLWNASPPIDGTGVTIAIVSASDINTSDVSQFRTIFGLPTISFTKVIPPGSTDPGVQANGSGDADETEAIFDVEWSGAVAKNAKIDLVASKDTSNSAGIDLSAEYIVDKMTPTPAVLSESYGQCELLLGTSGNAFYNQLWSQAAAEGITVSVSTGDDGAAGCDFVDTSKTGQQAAKYGLGVNGISSTPYNVAVGGTDFSDHAANSPYWNTGNSSGLLSAAGYVPELAWNDTCTNSLVFLAFGQASAAAACNSTAVQNDGNSQQFFFVSASGGAGGVSNCTAGPDGAGATSQCSGGYAKPSWQSGLTPPDGHRDVPDVAFLAEGAQDWLGLEDSLGQNVPGSYYFTCEGDAQGSGTPSKPAACSTSGSFLLGGGTSISAQAFAGIVALLDQRSGTALGNLNPNLYAAAASQSSINCDSSGGIPNSSCIFHDVTQGTIAMPCFLGSSNDGTPDCPPSAFGAIGVLTGYNAGTGYDLATGLGSINVANLANTMSYLSIAASPSTVTIPRPGQSGSTTVTFTANNGFAGTVNNLSCTGLPNGATCAFMQNGSAVTSLSFAPSMTSQSVTLTVNTTASSLIPPLPFTLPGSPAGPFRAEATWLVSLCFVFTLGLATFGGARYRRCCAAVFGLSAFVAAIAIVGCSGSSPLSGASASGNGTPSGTTTASVVVTDMASNAQIASSFTLTVQ